MDISKSPSLFKLANEAQIVELLKSQIQEHFVGVNMAQLKFDVHLIEAICQAVEDCVAYKGIKKANKLELFMSVYTSMLGGLSPTEEQQIVKIVEYVVDKLIVERGLLSKLVHFIYNCFRNKKSNK